MKKWLFLTLTILWQKPQNALNCGALEAVESKMARDLNLLDIRGVTQND